MKILKFGGTSVGTATSIRKVKHIISSQEGEQIIVVSAMSGITNDLVGLIRTLQKKRTEEAQQFLEDIEQKHLHLIEELFITAHVANPVRKKFLSQLSDLRDVISQKTCTEAAVVTFGEVFLSSILSAYLESEDVANTLLDAKDFMHISNVENPDINRVGQLLQICLEGNKASDIYITQGFVRKDENNNISTLNRGGSDFSASIIGAAIGAQEVQIWTDIDGFRNNDPRFVDDTATLKYLSFDEAAELAYFGAKILHPQTVSPVKDKNIPIFLKNTFTPEAAGTKIAAEINGLGIKAISAKDGITAIKIKSNRMLMAHGFLKKIFEVFDKHETAIDMITTSEIAISLTIDDTRNLDAILSDLEDYGELSVDEDHSIICIVGEGAINDKNTCHIFELLQEIPVRMISYGGSNNNISLLVDTSNKIAALRSLNQKLFEEKLLTDVC